MSAHDRAKRRAIKRNPRLAAEIRQGHRELTLRPPEGSLRPDPVASHVRSWAGALGAAATLRCRDALSEWDADEALEAAELTAKGGRIVRSGPCGDQHSYRLPSVQGPVEQSACAEVLEGLGMRIDADGRYCLRKSCSDDA